MEIGNSLMDEYIDYGAADEAEAEAMIDGENQKQEDWKIIEAMEKYDGSFAQAIAKACYHADGINYMRLRDAFPDLFEEYKKFIK